MATFLRENFNVLLFPLILIAVLMLFAVIGIIRGIFARYPVPARAFLAWLTPRFRKIVYVCGAIWALGIVVWYNVTVPISYVATLYIMRGFALTALAFLFSVYLPTLMLVYLPGFPLNGIMVRVRRALGILALLFGTTHGLMEFFIAYNGSLKTVFSLPAYYVTSLLLSTIASVLLIIMGMTSFDFLQSKMGKWWKLLHRFVYVVSLFILIHAFLIGSHFIHEGPLLSTTVIVASLAILFLKVGEGFKKTKAKSWSQGAKAASYAGLVLLVVGALYLTIQGLGIINATIH